MSNFNNKVNKNIAEIASSIIENTSLNELSKNTLKSYIDKNFEPSDRPGPEDERVSKHEENPIKRLNRYNGVVRAYTRLQGVTPKGKKYLAKESDGNQLYFSDLITIYKTNGFKNLQEALAEEVDNETFTKEVEKTKKKATEKTKDDNGISKPAVQAVQNEDQLNEIYYKLVAPSGEVHSKHANESSALKIKDSSPNFKSYKVVPVIESVEEITERELTPDEVAKKEEIVKAMKTKLGDFKQRYGSDRAKEVIYAAATARAKG